MAVRCKRCNRVLRDPLYAAIGYGAVCARKEGIVIPAAVKARVRITRRRSPRQRMKGGVRVDQLKGQLDMFDQIKKGDST